MSYEKREGYITGDRDYIKDTDIPVYTAKLHPNMPPEKVTLVEDYLSQHSLFLSELREEVQKLKNMKMIGIVGESKRSANFKNDGWHDALKKVLKFIDSKLDHNE